MATSNSNAPFLDMRSFEREEAEAPPSMPSATAPWSPFVSVYEFDDREGGYDDPVGEAYSTIVNELYDEEFDESLFELLTDARNMHQDQLAAGHSLPDADRLVSQHFNQLIRESEAMVDAVARQFASREGAIVEQEIDFFFENYAPATTLEPAFQDFLGKLVKKIGKGVRAVAGKALQGITQVALGPVLGRIKPLIRPLLNQVMQKAIGRLPQAVQPAARMLAQRLGLAAPPARTAPPPAATAAIEPAAADAAALPPAPAASADTAPLAPTTGTALPAQPPGESGSPVQAAAGQDVTELQTEFDEQIAEALLADDELQLDREIAQARAASVSANPVFTNLDQARDQFIHELGSLKEGENPAPYVENFLPAVLPALRIAMRIIGRPRVVNFLANLLGKLISNLVGPQQTPALSRAIVDAGLKLVSLELEEEDETRLATAGVAATVEETVSRVASLPDHVLEDQELLEAFTLEAFEQAAAANLPALFSEATYRRRPELLEGGINATWVMLPLRRPRYKRCSRTFNVRVTPHMAEAIEGFDDTLLSDYLQDQLGLPEGEDVEAEVHLFEVLPGSTVADITRNENETPGLGDSDEVTLSQLQPLTQEAAGVLLGRPALGRRLFAGSGIRTVAAGQRLYHLAIPGRRPLSVLTAAGRRRVRRQVHVTIILDIPRNQLRVCIFLSEVKTQKLAVRLRQQSHAGMITVGFDKMLGRRLPNILHGKRRRRLRIVQTGVPPGSSAAAFLDKLPTIVPPAFIAKLQAWLVQAFSEFIKTQSQAFLSAAEDPSDGVTLVFTIDQPPGLKELGQALVEKSATAGSVAQSVTTGSQPAVRVQALPGHRCD